MVVGIVVYMGVVIYQQYVLVGLGSQVFGYYGICEVGVDDQCVEGWCVVGGWVKQLLVVMYCECLQVMGVFRGG